MFTEMRTAALIQKAIHGPRALPANDTHKMPKINGARALGLEGEIGSIEVGKRADLILLNLDRPHATPRPDLVSTVVYSAQPGDVETVIIDGEIVMREGRLTTMDETEVLRDATREAARIAAE
jgi:cytosine/adenosine deaminase-related metal-dependent hydrolase